MYNSRLKGILADGLKFKPEEVSRIKKYLESNKKDKMIKSPTDLQPTKQQENTLFILDNYSLHDVA
jgi:hypothetical protein